MKNLFKIGGFTPYIVIVFLNAMTDLGHKIVLQNTILKAYDGADLIILTAIINGLILLPFIFLFSPAGFLSDRYSKTKIIKVASFFAIIITTLILVSYIMGWFWVAFGLTFILAGQSAIYSPAKYGLIKEMTGDRELTLANSLVQSITIISILAGTVIYSIFFEQLLPSGVEDKSEILRYIYPLGFALIFASILEFLLSLELIKRIDRKSIRVEQNPKRVGVKESIILLKESKTVWLSIIGLSIFWGLSQLVVAIFGAYIKKDLGIDNTVIANGILSLSGFGIIVGSLLVARLSKNYIERGIIPLGALGITLTLFFIPMVHSVSSLAILFFLYGVSSGVLIIPLNTLIQHITPQPIMGKVLAGNNLMQNIAMFSFLLLTTLFAYIGIDSSHLFTIAFIIALVGFIYSVRLLAQKMIRLVVRIVFGLFYDIDVQGLDNIDDSKGVLFLGNHISFLDWAFLQIAYPRQIHFVIDRTYYNLWYLKPIFRFFGAIPISTRGGKRALSLVAEALNRGESVALFPEGYLSRNGHMGKFQKGFELAVVDVTDAVIVPFYLRGLWEGRFSHASKKIKSKKLKDIGVSFGKPMSIKSSSVEVKNELFKLSVLSWQRYSSRLPTLPKMWIAQSKKVAHNLSVADSTGVELSGYRFITAVLLMRGKFKEIVKDEQNIGLILPTSVGGAIGNMAILTLGKTIVNLNYSSGTKSLKHAIKVANIKQIISSKQFITKLKAKGFDLSEALEGIDIIYLETLKKEISKSLQLKTFLIARFMPTSILSRFYIKDVKSSDTTAILFSSGSEGVPKGIELTHQNIVVNIKQFINLVNPTYSDVMVGTLPIFHSFGLTVTTLAPLIEGIPLVAHPDPTDGLSIAKLSHKYNGTLLFGTATFFRLYARNRKIHPMMFSSLRMVIAGAEKLPEDIRELFIKKFNKTILEGYGTTETSPVVSCNIYDVIVPDNYHIQVGNKFGTVGLPILGTAFMIVDPSSFEPLKVGEDGMILIGGTQVMKGYLLDPIKTDEVTREIDGIRWYITGDKGHIDQDGFLTIVDRYSRFAKVGGEMVSLGLVESELYKLLDEHSQLSITAIPDKKKGEKIVLLLEGEKDLATLKEEIKGLGLNPLFLPTAYYKVDKIPKLGTGKSDFSGAKRLALELELM